MPFKPPAMTCNLIGPLLGLGVQICYFGCKNIVSFSQLSNHVRAWNEPWPKLELHRLSVRLSVKEQRTQKKRRSKIYI